MIDVENQIFTKVATSLRADFQGINVIGDSTFEPSKFPCVCIEEIDSYIPENMSDSSTSEVFCEVTYEVNVYSNLSSGAKAECKNILNSVDKLLFSMNMRRLSKGLDDGNGVVKRMVARYRAVVGSNESIYRR